MERLRAVAPYIPLPNSRFANDFNGQVVDFSKEDGGAYADVYYPESFIELTWADTVYTDSDGPIIDGVRGTFDSCDSPRTSWGTRCRELFLQVLPSWGVFLEGPVPKSSLVDFAKTLMTDAASPDLPFPPSNPSDCPPCAIPYLQGETLLHAMPAPSVESAQSALPFQPVDPPALGAPTSILQSDPNYAPSQDRVLSLRYDDPSMGRFWLLERPSGSTTTDILRELVYDCPDANDCDASASMLDLGGVPALSVNLYDEAKRIFWVENGIYFEVIGSGNTFSAADALSVAKTVGAAAPG
jgi:hypothetical protein